MRQNLVYLFFGLLSSALQAADIYGVYPDRYSQFPVYVQKKMDQVALSCFDVDAKGHRLFFGVSDEKTIKQARGTLYRLEYFVIGMSYPTYVIELFRATNSKSLEVVTGDCPFGYK